METGQLQNAEEERRKRIVHLGSLAASECTRNTEEEESVFILETGQLQNAKEEERRKRIDLGSWPISKIDLSVGWNVKSTSVMTGL